MNNRNIHQHLNTLFFFLVYINLAEMTRLQTVYKEISHSKSERKTPPRPILNMQAKQSPYS